MADTDNLMLAQAKNLVAGLGNIYSALKNAFAVQGVGSFTMPAAASTTVQNGAMLTTSQVLCFPTNASAGTLQGSAKSLYVSAKAQGSFTVSTASGGNAAGVETYDYIIVNL